MARSDAPDPAVDELRRKARRRLVGAIALALAAAVLLPLLLENEPKPLGDDVSIQIPPVDSGKFVNPLSPAPSPEGKSKSDKPAETAPPAPPAQSSAGETTKSEPAKNDSAKGEPQPPSGAPAASPAPATTPAPPTKASEAESSEEKSIAPARSSKGDVKPGAASESKVETAKAGPYVVQVAAFSDGYGARSLVAKLKRDGFPGYTETVTTDKGTLHRVRVGPYASREVADAARAKLKAAGFSGVIARNG